MDVRETIELAVRLVGSQRELARLLDEREQHISDFKRGRACSYQKHAQIAAVAGMQDRAIRILLNGMADNLSEKIPHEAAAREALKAILNAFPEEQPTITPAPDKGASARGVAAEKPRLRKSLRT